QRRHADRGEFRVGGKSLRDGGKPGFQPVVVGDVVAVCELMNDDFRVPIGRLVEAPGEAQKIVQTLRTLFRLSGVYAKPCNVVRYSCAVIGMEGRDDVVIAFARCIGATEAELAGAGGGGTEVVRTAELGDEKVVKRPVSVEVDVQVAHEQRR